MTVVPPTINATVVSLGVGCEANLDLIFAEFGIIPFNNSLFVYYISFSKINGTTSSCKIVRHIPLPY